MNNDDNNNSIKISVGAKIVHPRYGAATVEDMKEEEVDGKTKLYYVLNVPTNDLTVSVPANGPNLNFRPIHEKSELMEIIARADFGSIKATKSKNWTEAYNKNLEKVKSGNLEEVVSVLKYLSDKERRSHALSITEKRMMSSARQIVASEVMLAFDMSKAEAESALKEWVSKKPSP